MICFNLGTRYVLSVSVVNILILNSQNKWWNKYSAENLNKILHNNLFVCMFPFTSYAKILTSVMVSSVAVLVKVLVVKLHCIYVCFSESHVNTWRVVMKHNIYFWQTHVTKIPHVIICVSTVSVLVLSY